VLDPRWWSLARALDAPRAASPRLFRTHVDEMRWFSTCEPANQLFGAWTTLDAARAGISLRSPFMDRRLMELVLGTPPELRPHAVDSGRYKPLLGDATRGLLPAPLTAKYWKVDFTPFNERVMHETIRSGVLAVDSTWRASRYVDHARAARLAERFRLTPPGGSVIVHSSLFRLVGTDAWMRHTE
jgi:hypothetical protein